eukprot:COSAG03_NODE_1400_length_4162_cov_2.047502_1_plen_52_part_10
MSLLQVALGATKAELDITKTVMKMEMGELSEVLPKQHTQWVGGREGERERER